MEQLAPSYIAPNQWGNGVNVDDVLDSLGIAPADLVAEHTPMIVSTGNRFMIIPVESQAVLSSMDVNQDLIQSISEKLDLIGYYAFARNDSDANHVATARMFAPHYGIPEEAATGMAAGPLACYLCDLMDVGSSTMLIEQGRFMSPPSPSLISVRLTIDNGAISQLMVGGSARVSDVRTLTLRTTCPASLLRRPNPDPAATAGQSGHRQCRPRRVPQSSGRRCRPARLSTSRPQ